MGIRLTAISATDQQQVLSRLRNGDERILNELYRLYFEKLLYYGMQHLNDEFSLTNIIHECFIKAWNYREKMERVEHFYYFIKMNMRWHFQKYYCSARYRFYRSTFLTEKPEQEFQNVLTSDTDIKQKELTEERLEAIYNVIPLLPMNRSNVILLHYKYGLSYKAIAKRVGFTNKKVIAELEKSVKSIKSMLAVRDIKEGSKAIKAKPRAVTDDSRPLCSEEVLKLRRDEQLGFEEIAEMYGVSKAEILSLYLKSIS
jgi:RNA polymerase sigma factor (sigma-70 family)